jgi:hypothetical protein
VGEREREGEGRMETLRRRRGSNKKQNGYSAPHVLVEGVEAAQQKLNILLHEGVRGQVESVKHLKGVAAGDTVSTAPGRANTCSLPTTRDTHVFLVHLPSQVGDDGLGQRRHPQYHRDLLKDGGRRDAVALDAVKGKKVGIVSKRIKGNERVA